MLELAPQIVRAPQNGNVHRMLGVRLANDAAVAVRRPECVARCPAVQAEHVEAAKREVIRGGASHGAKSGDDDVEFRHCQSLGWRRSRTVNVSSSSYLAIAPVPRV